MTKKEIMGALARGYTYPKNSHKVLDGDLINDMANEVWTLVNKPTTNVIKTFRLKPHKSRKSFK